MKELLLKFYMNMPIVQKIWNRLKNVMKEYSLKKIIKKNRNLLIFTPLHGNLGDHAIALAEQYIFADMKIKYGELTGDDLEFLCINNKLSLMDGKNIIFNGGGNLGSLWKDVEELNRKIINANPRSTIIFMPNSIYYSDSEEDCNFFEESINIYNHHEHLYLLGRERISYELMNKVYINTYMFPDVAFYLHNIFHFDEDRNGCLICLRNDCEKTLSDSNSTNLHSLLLNYFEKVEFTDTVKPYKIHFRDRYKEVYEKLLDFSKAEVIVTDRLHGMIFAFLTNTPCIILNSKSPKLKGCYEWIKKSKNLIFLDDYDENKIIDFILKMDENSSDNDFSDIDKQYECMKDYIRILIK